MSSLSISVIWYDRLRWSCASHHKTATLILS